MAAEYPPIPDAGCSIFVKRVAEAKAQPQHNPNKYRQLESLTRYPARKLKYKTPTGMYMPIKSKQRRIK
jgi:hypothetical protein